MGRYEEKSEQSKPSVTIGKVGRRREQQENQTAKGTQSDALAITPEGRDMAFHAARYPPNFFLAKDGREMGNPSQQLVAIVELVEKGAGQQFGMVCADKLFGQFKTFPSVVYVGLDMAMEVVF